MTDLAERVERLTEAQRKFLEQCGAKRIQAALRASLRTGEQ